MDPTLLVGSLIVALTTLLCVAATGFFFVFVFWRIRVGQKRRMAAAAQDAATEEVPPPTPDPVDPSLLETATTARSLDTSAPIPPPAPDIPDVDPTERMEVRPTGHPDEITSPSVPSGELSKPNLLGFFDDETTGGASDNAATELFQRGAKAYEWDDDDDDNEDATEVFSAHHAAELAGDFEIEDD